MNDPGRDHDPRTRAYQLAPATLELKDLQELGADHRETDAVLGTLVARYGRDAVERYVDQRAPRLRETLSDSLLLNDLADAMLGGSRWAGLVGGSEYGPILADGRRRYTVHSLLGKGATSAVFKATDRLLSSEDHPSHVVLKVFDAGIGRAAVTAEARAAGRIDSELTPRVIDVSADDDEIPFIAFQWCSGRRLTTWKRESAPIAQREIVSVMALAARGVEAIHGAGLTHNDVKPSNILRSPDGRVKVIDYGLARDDDAEPVGDGTPGFAPPEGVSVEGGTGARVADTYGLGASLFWLLSGQTPEDSGAARRFVRNRDLARIVDRAVHQDPKKRYQSAAAFGDDLDAWLARRPIAWTKPSLPRRLVLLARRRPLQVVVGVCALVIAVHFALLVQSANALTKQVETQQALAASERALLDAERGWRQQAALDLMRLLDGFDSARRAGLQNEVLTSLWVLDWVHGSSVLRDPQMVRQIWDQRVSLLRDQLDALVADDLGDTVTAQLLRTSIALWLLETGEHREAESLAAEAARFWDKHADPADPWRAQNAIIGALASLEIAKGTSPGTPDVHEAEARRLIEAIRPEHLSVPLRRAIERAGLDSQTG